MTGNLGDEVALYVCRAFDEMLEVAARAGDDRVNLRPLGPSTNSIAALVIHCAGVCEFWLGHVGLGRPSTRDRDREFDQQATLAELERLIALTVAQVESDLRELDQRDGEPSELRAFLPADGTDRSLVLHVLEELYQHLGHMEITADVLAQDERPDA
jgi:hypothetical protein